MPTLCIQGGVLGQHLQSDWEKKMAIKSQLPIPDPGQILLIDCGTPHETWVICILETLGGPGILHPGICQGPHDSRAERGTVSSNPWWERSMPGWALTQYLPGDSLDDNSGYLSDGPALWIVKRTLRMVQTGQGPDFLLGNCGPVGWLQRGKQQQKTDTEWEIELVKNHKSKKNFFCLLAKQFDCNMIRTKTLIGI